MKVYTNQTETVFFKTDDHVKNLHEIEINSIKDFVHRYSIDEMILLDVKDWMICRFDELKPGKQVVTSFDDEPELIGEVFTDFDFLEGFKLLDIDNNRYSEMPDAILEAFFDGLFIYRDEQGNKGNMVFNFPGNYLKDK